MVGMKVVEGLLLGWLYLLAPSEREHISKEQGMIERHGIKKLIILTLAWPVNLLVGGSILAVTAFAIICMTAVHLGGGDIDADFVRIRAEQERIRRISLE